MVDGVTETPPIVSTSMTSTQAATGLGALDGDTFLQLMVAQLKYQNPFQPMDSTQMLQQTAALTTVQTLQQLSSAQTLLMGLQEASMASSMIGKVVTASDADGNEIVGLVTGVGFTDQGPVLHLEEGQEVPIGAVVNVTEPEDDEAPSDAPPATTQTIDTQTIEPSPDGSAAPPSQG
jgi:flagellar basal-body rod modification protein FlgD